MDAATELVDKDAHTRFLEDIEAQCTSHQRHPGEWDLLDHTWIDQTAEARPYQPVSVTLLKPRRPREVICELLGFGIPISPSAHLALNNILDVKGFIKQSKKLVGAVRQPGVVLVQAEAARALNIISDEQAQYVKLVSEALAQGLIAEHAVLKAVRSSHSVHIKRCRKYLQTFAVNYVLLSLRCSLEYVCERSKVAV
jgi:hypothetical protein